MVHASLCFIQESYTPKARFHPSFEGITWKDIIGVGRLESVEWANGIDQVVEMDLFDISGVPILLEGYLSNPGSIEWGDRLEFMSSIRTLDESPDWSSEANCDSRRGSPCSLERAENPKSLAEDGGVKCATCLYCHAGISSSWYVSRPTLSFYVAH